jgi:GNAT superfamily N-acetyltransferase
MEALRIRPVRPDECAGAGRLVVSAYRALPGSHLSDDYAEVLADVAGRATGAEVLVAVRPEVVGCVTFVADAGSPWAEHLEPGEAGVRALAVEPAVQGQGVGRALLTACAERALELGRTALFLHSTAWMHAAHRLYLNTGFVRVPSRDFEPVPEVSLLAFRLDLSARP